MSLNPKNWIKRLVSNDSKMKKAEKRASMEDVIGSTESSENESVKEAQDKESSKEEETKDAKSCAKKAIKDAVNEVEKTAKDKDEDEEEDLPVKVKERKQKPREFKVEDVESAPVADEDLRGFLNKLNENIDKLDEIKEKKKELKREYNQKIQKMEEEEKKDEVSQKVEEFAKEVEKRVEKAEGKVVDLGDMFIGADWPETSPRFSYKQKLDKIKERFDGVEEYLENAKRGLKSQTKKKSYKRLLKWPKPESMKKKEKEDFEHLESSKKTAEDDIDFQEILDNLDSYIEEVSDIKAEAEELLEAPEKVEEVEEVEEPAIDLIPEPVAAELKEEMTAALNTPRHTGSSGRLIAELKEEMTAALNKEETTDKVESSQKQETKATQDIVLNIGGKDKEFTKELNKTSSLTLSQLLEYHVMEGDLGKEVEATVKEHKTLLEGVSNVAKLEDLLKKAGIENINEVMSIKKGSNLTEQQIQKLEKIYERYGDEEAKELIERINRSENSLSDLTEQQIQKLEKMYERYGDEEAKELIELSNKSKSSFSNLTEQHIQKLERIYEKTGDEEIKELINKSENSLSEEQELNREPMEPSDVVDVEPEELKDGYEVKDLE